MSKTIGDSQTLIFEPTGYTVTITREEFNGDTFDGLGYRREMLPVSYGSLGGLSIGEDTTQTFEANRLYREKAVFEWDLIVDESKLVQLITLRNLQYFSISTGLDFPIVLEDRRLSSSEFIETFSDPEAFYDPVDDYRDFVDAVILDDSGNSFREQWSVFSLIFQTFEWKRYVDGLYRVKLVAQEAEFVSRLDETDGFNPPITYLCIHEYLTNGVGDPQIDVGGVSVQDHQIVRISDGSYVELLVTTTPDYARLYTFDNTVNYTLKSPGDGQPVGANVYILLSNDLYIIAVRTDNGHYTILDHGLNALIVIIDGSYGFGDTTLEYSAFQGLDGEFYIATRGHDAASPATTSGGNLYKVDTNSGLRTLITEQTLGGSDYPRFYDTDGTNVYSTRVVDNKKVFYNGVEVYEVTTPGTFDQFTNSNSYYARTTSIVRDSEDLWYLFLNGVLIFTGTVIPTAGGFRNKNATFWVAGSTTGIFTYRGSAGNRTLATATLETFDVFDNVSPNSPVPAVSSFFTVDSDVANGDTGFFYTDRGSTAPGDLATTSNYFAEFTTDIACPVPSFQLNQIPNKFCFNKSALPPDAEFPLGSGDILFNMIPFYSSVSTPKVGRLLVSDYFVKAVIGGFNDEPIVSLDIKRVTPPTTLSLFEKLTNAVAKGDNTLWFPTANGDYTITDENLVPIFSIAGTAWVPAGILADIALFKLYTRIFLGADGEFYYSFVYRQDQGGEGFLYRVDVGSQVLVDQRFPPTAGTNPGTAIMYFDVMSNGDVYFGWEKEIYESGTFVTNIPNVGFTPVLAFDNRTVYTRDTAIYLTDTANIITIDETTQTVNIIGTSNTQVFVDGFLTPSASAWLNQPSVIASAFDSGDTAITALVTPTQDRVIIDEAFEGDIDDLTLPTSAIPFPVTGHISAANGGSTQFYFTVPVPTSGDRNYATYEDVEIYSGDILEPTTTICPTTPFLTNSRKFAIYKASLPADVDFPGGTENIRFFIPFYSSNSNPKVGWLLSSNFVVKAVKGGYNGQPITSIDLFRTVLPAEIPENNIVTNVIEKGDDRLLFLSRNGDYTITDEDFSVISSVLGSSYLPAQVVTDINLGQVSTRVQLGADGEWYASFTYSNSFGGEARLYRIEDTGETLVETRLPPTVLPEADQLITYVDVMSNGDIYFSWGDSMYRNGFFFFNLGLISSYPPFFVQGNSSPVYPRDKAVYITDEGKLVTIDETTLQVTVTSGAGGQIYADGAFDLQGSSWFGNPASVSYAFSSGDPEITLLIAPGGQKAYSFENDEITISDFVLTDSPENFPMGGIINQVNAGSSGFFFTVSIPALTDIVRADYDQLEIYAFLILPFSTTTSPATPF